jgi:hypothetical protein
MPNDVVSNTPHHPIACSYVGLSLQIRDTVSTAEAAYYLNRKEQTLRRWACYEDGPLRPIRVNGRLAWRVADIKRVLQIGGA